MYEKLQKVSDAVNKNNKAISFLKAENDKLVWEFANHYYHDGMLVMCEEPDSSLRNGKYLICLKSYQNVRMVPNSIWGPMLYIECRYITKAGHPTKVRSTLLPIIYMKIIQNGADET
jgi:hypothetical protein